MAGYKAERSEPIKNGILIDAVIGEEAPYYMSSMKEVDIGEMLRLQKQVFMEDNLNVLWFYPFKSLELKSILKIENNIVIGVFVRERLIAFRVGCCCGREYQEIVSALGGRYKEIPCFLMNGAFVENRYRGNNLQQMMSQYSIDRCREIGIKTFLTAIHPDNASSIKSLTNIGFEVRARKMLYNNKYDRTILVKEES
ncbi:MAG: hypothetical protein PHV71_03540 [Eubacteriales bacterium]|nr:hypothetical protein [Eubacteriales bacterium]MDD4121602.1 hypothetical protein [Eubacteriales bacterium]MDD4629662.1 hypothetical protein [Eubacteriales bacterium]